MQLPHFHVHVHVEDVVKTKSKFKFISKGAFCWYTLHNYWTWGSVVVEALRY
jgi:hypothetical protein